MQSPAADAHGNHSNVNRPLEILPGTKFDERKYTLEIREFRINFFFSENFGRPTFDVFNHVFDVDIVS